MMKTYQNTADKVEDKEIKAIFLALTASEKKHSELVTKITKIICPDEKI
ncbi:MAG: hypothetical protein ISS33_05220 [Candidatus Omnitrophica bacterium]|nr:hypothetical protein [Candidatus Omnitrophota bacterium]